MDPNATLAKIIELSTKIQELRDQFTLTSQDAADLEMHAADLAEASIALNDWLTMGGFMPAAWRTAQRRDWIPVESTNPS